MFATLLGGLPRPIVDDAADLDAQVVAAIREQEEAGLEPITDGRLRDPGFDDLAAHLERQATHERTTVATPVAVDWWRFAASQTTRAVKQALPGPYSLGRRLGAIGRAHDELRTRLADALRTEVDALASAGCPLVEIEEADAHLIGADDDERRIFREAHRRLAEGVVGTHLSLSIVGGSADGAGPETILAAPYASFAFDLIAGPDNWNLVASVPSDRGVILGVLGTRDASDEPKEVQLWAAHYAASTRGRGLARVGLGSAGSFANLAWEVAVRKLRRLGEAARLAQLPPGEELTRSVDPRAVSSRRAALGHDAPPPPPRSRR